MFVNTRNIGIKTRDQAFVFNFQWIESNSENFMAAWKWKCYSLSQVWLCNRMDCGLPVSSAHGILQARRVEWAAIPFSRGSSQPRVWTWVSCIAADSLLFEPPDLDCFHRIAYWHFSHLKLIMNTSWKFSFSRACSRE